MLVIVCCGAWMGTELCEFDKVSPPLSRVLCKELNWMVNSGVIYPVIH